MRFLAKRMRSHRKGNAFELLQALHRIRVCISHLRVDLVGDQNLAWRGNTLEARRDISHVPHYRIVLAVVRPHGGRQRHTCGDSYTHFEQIILAQAGVDLGNDSLDLLGRLHGMVHMVLTSYRHVEKSHHRVAPEIVQNAVVADHYVAATPEELVDQGVISSGPRW